jgi:hypothetical protein
MIRATALLAALALAGCGNLPGFPIATAADEPQAFTEATSAAEDHTVPYESLAYDARVPAPLPRKDNVWIGSVGSLDAFLDEIGASPDGRPQVDFATREVLAFYRPGSAAPCALQGALVLWESGDAITHHFKSVKPVDCLPSTGPAYYQFVTIARTAKPLHGLTAYTYQPTGVTSVAFRVLNHGIPWGGAPEPGTAIARDAEAYAKLLTGPFPNGKAPEVDFSREMVLAAFLGTKPTGGYGIGVSAVQEEPEGLRVRLTVSSPTPGLGVTQASTRPFVLVAVPRSDKPVRFEGLTTP